MNDNYLNELNEVQKQAAINIAGPMMIVAGAGSGKTRVLTYRIAHLLQTGVDAFNVLALTFTNKAARSMKDRIKLIVGGNESKNLWMGTFHSVFARILRAEAEKIGYPTNFTIYDTEDTKGLIKDIVKSLNLDEKVYKPALVYSRISAAKNSLISAAAYNANKQVQEEDKMSGKPLLGQIYETYAKRCFKAGAMDFDDLLFNTNVLLRDFPEVLLKYQERFKYILVDEYQDTNFSQYVIIKQLAARYENICVVGDDAQSIYAFRGANIQNILNFEKDYPDLKVFKLEQNYRSTNTIVQAANNVIANNKDQLKKQVWTDNERGEKIKLIRAMTDNEEGAKVAQSIFETKMNKQAHNKEFAILYRTNAQSRAMEEALRKLNVPYKIFGGLSFYQRKEVKDMVAYLRLTVNNHDEESLKRIINYPARGIGDTTVQKLMVAATDHDVSIWTVMENINEFTDLNSGTKSKIADFVAMIKSFSSQAEIKNAYEIGELIANSSGLLREFYTDKTPEGVSRYENIQELLNGLKEFSDEAEQQEMVNQAIELTKIVEEVNEGDGAITVNPPRSLAAYLQDIALLTDADKESDTEKDYVSLMTIHAAKGLEFSYVYVVGLEENLFPSQMSLNSRTDLEEERRLFYVALTRAEKKATLSYAVTRYRWGNLINSEPSRFLEEISAEHLEMPASLTEFDEPVFDNNEVRRTNTFRPKSSVTAKPVVTTPSPIKKNLIRMNTAANSDTTHNPELLKDLQVGMSVAHERFGTGKVIQMEGFFPYNKATILFDNAGQKQLLIKFAKLQILG